MENKLALTIDVEDGLSIAMRDHFNVNIPQTDRVVDCTMEILEVLSSTNYKATFFTLGKVAEDFPILIKEIVKNGHELAVHGFEHIELHKLTKVSAFEELYRAKNSLEQISGVNVIGHRAPAFTLTSETSWIFDVLIQLGFSYDSSIMPRKSLNYGWEGFPLDITDVRTKNGRILEFPISTFPIAGIKLPFSGGGYLRLLPTALIKMAFKRTLEKRHAVLYVHPYEFDRRPYPDFYFEEFNRLDIRTRLKLRTNFWNRGNALKKLAALIDVFEFDRMDRIISESLVKDVIHVSK